MRVIIRGLVDIAFSLHVVHTGLSYILIFRLTYYLLFCLLFRVYFPPLYPIIACMNQSILSKLQSAYRGDEDFRMRNITCGEGKFVVVNLDTMTDHVKVSQFVLQPLVYASGAQTVADIVTYLVAADGIVECLTYDAALNNFVNGYTLVLDSSDGCIAVDTRTQSGRSITEPPTSMVMRGPREGFVEDVKVNVTLLRKRLKTPHFKTIQLSVGKYTSTAVVVCYIDGVADKKVVGNVVQRLQEINIDGVLDSSYLAKYLDVEHTVLFRRVGMTEKPDVAVGKMLEGRIAVISDGSPMVLTVPYLFVEDLQSPGDYYENAAMTSLNRVLRFVSVLVSVLLPALYVCMQMYNYQIIPLKFLLTILNATEAIPFSPFAEMMLVIVIFDILREANLRMPSAVGISLSLVGAIVLGDAAVKAGLIGAPAVMIGALSGIGLFTMSDNTLVLSLLRILFTVAGGVGGIFGIMLLMLATMVYLCALQNDHTPFLAPFAPEIPTDRRDAVGQMPLPQQKKRPRSIPNVNHTRRD